MSGSSCRTANSSSIQHGTRCSSQAAPASRRSRHSSRSLEAGRAPRVLLFYGARTPNLFVYGPLAEARAREVPSLTCRLVCEATDGRLAVDAAWPAITELHSPVFYLSGPPAMLGALTAQLRGHGASPDSIRTDAWE